MKRAHQYITAALLGATTSVAASSAQAQDTPSARPQAAVAGPQRLPAWGRHIATVADTTAVVVNPANLAHLPGGELRWQGVYLRNEATLPYEGHAIGLGLPIPIAHLGAATRLDLVTPPTEGGPIQEPYNWLTWGIGVGSDSAAFGMSLQRSYSNDESLHALVSWTAGLTVRPWNSLAFAVVASHFNAPVNDYSGSVDRTFDFGAALRPTGSDAVEIGLETRLVDPPQDNRDQFWVPRFTLGVAVPRLGRLHGDLAITDLGEKIGPRSWLASAGLTVNLNGARAATEVGGGALLGDALGASAQDRVGENIYSEAAVKIYREPAGIEIPRFAIRIRLEQTPTTREHVDLLRTLWWIAEHERSVSAVVLELRAPPAASMSLTQELRDAIRYLQANGKRVLCHLEENRGRALYACAAADRILIEPAGGVQFAGLRSQRLYYARLLQKLGIRADFVRLGEHKSAPEAFERDGASDVAMADRLELMQQFERYYAGAIASGRNLRVDVVRARLAEGPFTAEEAKQDGFVDEFAFDDEIEQSVRRLVRRPVSLIKREDVAPRKDRRFGTNAKVAIVYATGTIADGRSRTVPLAGMRTMGSYSFAETLQEVRENDNVRAVVLRIDSPGGSAMASDVIWREVELLAKKKPVVVSMGTVAASGGYYIAAPATRIFANPLTITGSVGVYAGKADATELMQRLGVTSEVVKTAPHADANSIFRPYTPEERLALQQRVEQYYDVFLSRVAKGRNLTKEQVDMVGRGKVWTGEQAVEKKLVDEVGGLRQALDYARRAGRLPRHAPIVEYPPPSRSLLGQVLGLEGVGTKSPAEFLPEEVARIATALAPFVVFDPNEPMALLELVDVSP